MEVKISAAVEGPTDEAVVRRLIAYVGAKLGKVYGKKGKSHLKDKITAYNCAAQHSPWIVLADLDSDFDCAPPLRASWLPQPAQRMCFRVAVRAVEAWLLADAEAIADFLHVGRGKVPANPEAMPDPKQVLVNLARESGRRDVRADIVPRDGSGRRVGPAYSSRLVEFVENHWRPQVAAAHAASLKRTICCLRRLV